MLRVLILTFVAGLVALLPAAAQQQEVAQGHAGERAFDLEYLLHVPNAEPGTRLPMILFLHGAGERGEDLDLVKVHGPPKLVEQDPAFPFVVLSPQCPRDQWWELPALLTLLDQVCEEYPVDRDRVYLTGLSMGGYGSWGLAALAPERFAAVAPICGGGEPGDASRLKDLPFWVFHGAKDRVVPPEQSRRMVAALEAVGADVRYTEYPEAGHDSWTESYANPELFEWFLTHRRPATATATGGLPRAAPETVGMSGETLQEAAASVQRLVEQARVAGTVTLVARRGKVVLEHVAGHRDVEAGEPMTADTLFRIYSMTKPITSVAAMMLVEEGALGLDDPVSWYLPEFEDLRRHTSGPADAMQTGPVEQEMTIRDLLRHTSGLTYGLFGNTAVDQSYRLARVGDPERDLQSMIERLSTCPLLFEPGTRWVYSLSSDVLGRVVEVVAETPFDEFLARRLFEPLGMRDTGFHVPPEKRARFASNYGPDPDGGLRVVDDRDASRYGRPAVYFSGGGGLVSTAGDYLRFCQMLLNDGELDGTRILEPATVAAMTRNQLPEAVQANGGVLGDRNLGFGLGFSVRLQDGLGAVRGEYGWGGAASTHFWISPEDELIVVALSQVMPMNPQLERAWKAKVYAAIEDRDPARGR